MLSHCCDITQVRSPIFSFNDCFFFFSFLSRFTISYYSDPFAGISLDFIFVGHAFVDDATYGDNLHSARFVASWNYVLLWLREIASTELSVLQIVSRQTINVYPRTSHKSKSTSSLDSISECASVLIPFQRRKLQTNTFSLSDSFARLFSFYIIFISHFQLFFFLFSVQTTF